MSKTATLNLRVNPAVKQSAEEVLDRLGVPMSTAVNMFLHQVTLCGGLPFSVQLPQGPDALNLAKMSEATLHAKLAHSLAQAERGETREASRVFQKFREAHR